MPELWKCISYFDRSVSRTMKINYNFCVDFFTISFFQATQIDKVSLQSTVVYVESLASNLIDPEIFGQVHFVRRAGKMCQLPGAEQENRTGPPSWTRVQTSPLFSGQAASRSEQHSQRTFIEAHFSMETTPHPAAMDPRRGKSFPYFSLKEMCVYLMRERAPVCGYALVFVAVLRLPLSAPWIEELPNRRNRARYRNVLKQIQAHDRACCCWPQSSTSHPSTLRCP